MNQSEWLRYVRQVAEANGACVETTNGGHLVIRHPDGWQVFASRTPSDWRGPANLARDVRRIRSAIPRYRSS